MKDSPSIKVNKSLNCGCGPVSRWIPNTEGLDIEDFGQKWLGSVLEFDPPYEYDLVFAHHLIEHFQDTVTLVEKLGSFLKVGGVLDIRVPTLPYEQIFIDPTHLKIIPEHADIFFSYFTKHSPAGNRYTNCEFEILGSERDRYEWEWHGQLKLISK